MKLAIGYLLISIFLCTIFAGVSAINPKADANPKILQVEKIYPKNASDLNQVPDQMLEQTLLALYEFNFHKADSISKRFELTHPEDYLSHFARTNYYWWKIVSGSETDEYKELFTTSISSSLSVLGRNPDNNTIEPSDLFYLIGIYAMYTRLDLMNKLYVRAMRNGRNAIGYVEMSKGMESVYEAFYLTSGLYHYLTAQADRKHPFFRVYSLLFPGGDRDLGLSQLKKAAGSENLIWQTEANYFLMRIFLEMEERPDLALPYAAWLTGRFPSNLIFQYYHMQVYKGLGQGNRVRAKSDEILQTAAINPNMSRQQRDYFIRLAGGRK